MSQHLSAAVTLSDKVETSLLPAFPEPKSDLDSLFTLWCMERPPQVTTRIFRYNGSFKDATQKARNYCENMSYRFLYCRPFITDLDQEIKVRNGSI